MIWVQRSVQIAKGEVLELPNKKEMTLDECYRTVKGHFCSILVSNIIG